MRICKPVIAAGLTAAASCTDGGLLAPDREPRRDAPVFEISDSGHGSPIDGIWFLPPLTKQVRTEGVLDEDLAPTMYVCRLSDVPPEAGGADAVDCDPDQAPVTMFPEGSATLVPGAHYQFSWNTGPTAPENVAPMDPAAFYRLNIALAGRRVAHMDVNPQNPAPGTPGEDFEGLLAFRLGETLPVKIFVSPQVRCALGDPQATEYVVQCVAAGVIGDDGGSVTLEPIPSWPAKLTTILPAGALPGGLPRIVLTMERIDPTAFLAETGEECIPGLPGVPGFDAPQFGDCLRVTTDPELDAPLELAALIEMCIPLDATDPALASLKWDEEQDTRLQIIRFDDRPAPEGGRIEGLANVRAISCDTGPAGADQVGFFPVPTRDGLLRTAALTANTVARWLGPEALSAHGLGIDLGGSTWVFSRFRWGLPGQMIAASGDGNVIQTLEDGSESRDVLVQARVVDSGSPASADFPEGLPPSTVEAATVHFAGADGAVPADVATGSDGLASAVWTVPSTPGVHTLTASALGLLDGPVPDHGGAVLFEPSQVTFSATVIGAPSDATQSPASDPPLAGLPGTTLSTPLTVTVVDAEGRPVSGWSVTWTTTCAAEAGLCDGFVSNDEDGDPTNDDGSHLVTDALGQATGFWTLATLPGVNGLTVTIGGTSFDFVAASWTATSGCAVAIDGVVEPGEWDCADPTVTTFTASLSGGSAPADVRWQNDGSNLYLLVRVEQTSAGGSNNLRIDFDNVWGDGPSEGDDAIGLIWKGTGTGSFLDQYLTDRCVNQSQAGCGSDDTNGLPPGAGAATNDGTHTVYELAHPLAGDGVQDFRVASGDEIGLFLTLSIGKGAQGNTQFPGFRRYLKVRIQ